MPKRKNDLFSEQYIEEFLDNDIPVRLRSRLESDDEESNMEFSSEIKSEPCEVSEMNGNSLAIEEHVTRSVGIQTDLVYENNGNFQHILNTLKTEYLVKTKLMVEHLFQSIEKVVSDSSRSKNGKELEQNTLEQLLSSWDLKHLLQFFQEQNITIKTLSLMSSNDLSEISKEMKIGDKILFKHNLEKWRRQNNHTPMAHQESAMSWEAQESQSSSNEVENPKITVLEILKQHKSGIKILKYYETAQKISEEHRSCLMNIIVQHFESKDLHMSLQTSYQIENEILKIFPTEKLEYYRTERRGKIYIKCCNKKKILKSLQTDSATTATKDFLVPEDDAHVYIQRLGLPNLTAKEFSFAWTACCKYRLNQIRNECQSLKDALQLWPQYRGANGCKCIESDFKAIHKNPPTILSWENKFLKLFNYLKNQTSSDKILNKILTTLEKSQPEEDKDLFYLKLLWCLHSNLYQTKRYARKNDNGKMVYGKFTIRNSQESFIYINSTMQSLEEHLTALSSSNDADVVVQPFILALGEVDTFKIDKFFVNLNGQLIIFDSFQEAFDICFKIFHIFDIDYPMASEPFWLFVENYFYGILKNEKTNTKVSILLDQLSKM